MALLDFQKLWDSHPYPDAPCDSSFTNQCAIRMSVALRGAGVNLDSFNGAVCYPGFGHRPRHVLRAQELANWLRRQVALVGTRTVHKNVTWADFSGQKGIVFVLDGWGATDHIDAWNGMALKGGQRDYFEKGKEIWFWKLA